VVFFDYIYLCIYSIVPESTPFGRDQVTATFHAVLLFFIYLTIFLWIAVYWIDLRTIDFYWEAVLFMIFIAHFFFSRIYFLRKQKQRELIEKYNSYMKWKLKLTAILLIIFCYCFFIISGFIINDSRKETSHIESSQSILQNFLF